MPSDPPGLRERKKQQTRQLIADTAHRLFLDRGFDAVSVVEIAQAADVAEKTVYNYFPTKEDLVIRRMEAFEERLLDAVRHRKTGESALTAFGRFLRGTTLVLTERAATGELKSIARVMMNSPTLQQREQQVYLLYTASLTELLAHETRADRNDIKPWIVANALMGVHRAIVDYVRRRSLAGASTRDLERDVDKQTRQALRTLQQGLGGYAVKRRAA